MAGDLYQIVGVFVNKFYTALNMDLNELKLSLGASGVLDSNLMVGNQVDEVARFEDVESMVFTNVTSSVVAVPTNCGGMEYEFPFQCMDDEWFVHELCVYNDEFWNSYTGCIEVVSVCQEVKYDYLPVHMKIPILMCGVVNRLEVGCDIPMLFRIASSLYFMSGCGILPVLETVLEAMNDYTEFSDFSDMYYAYRVTKHKLVFNVRDHLFISYYDDLNVFDVIDFVDRNGGFLSILGSFLHSIVQTLNLHRVSGQLNGNNGSWTNTDDVDWDGVPLVEKPPLPLPPVNTVSAALAKIRRENSLSALNASSVKKPVLTPMPNMMPNARDSANRKLPLASKTIIEVKTNKNHLHQKPISGGRNAEYDPDDPRPNAARRVKEKTSKKDTTGAEPKDKLDPKRKRRTNKIVYLDNDRCGWDGRQAYVLCPTNPVLCFGLNDGKTATVCVNNFQVFNRVSSSGLGYVEVFIDDIDESDGEVLSCISSPWESLWVDGGFIWEGHSFTRTLYSVFTPALNFLKTKFSSTVITESLVNGMMAALNREFKLGDQFTDLLTETIQYYIHFCHFTNHKMARSFMCKSKPVLKDRVEEAYMSVLNLQRSEEHIVRFNSVDCDVADSYFGRNDCFVTCGDQVWTQNHGFVPGNQDSYPHFATAEVGANDFKYYRTSFLRFDGNDRKPFVTYSVNAINAQKALKRLVGARENVDYDHYLSSMQYSAYAEILNRGFDPVAYCDDHFEFFKIGRIEPLFTHGYLTSFKIGRPSWDSCMPETFDTPAGRTFRRPRYLTPYLSRPLSFHTKPIPVNSSLTCSGPTELYRPVTLWDAATSLSLTKLCEATVYEESCLRQWMTKPENTELSYYSGDAVELNSVHQQMYEGFQVLLEKHNRVTLDKYADAHRDWLYFEGYQRFLTMMDCETDRVWHASIKHVKKLLRVMYVTQQRVHTPNDIMVKTVNAKVKKEFAKFGKVPRLFVTYDAGCMFANELPEYSKVCLDGTYSFHTNGVSTSITIFAKPSTSALKSVLNEAIYSMHRPNHLNILVYSDDSVWSGNMNGVDFAFNVDISSCDSGNKAGTFGLVYQLLCQFRSDLALGLMAQCANTINVVNPEDKDECMRVEMGTYFEGSGTVLTTILNHVAMYMIGQAAVALFGWRRESLRCWQDISKLIIECGSCFGHILTVEPCLDGSQFCPERIQFLKRSPLQTTSGVYVPCMNYGPIFRSFGSVEGDMVAEMVGLDVDDFKALSWSERWDLFGSRVIAGLVNEPSSIILRALRQRYSCTPKNFSSWSEVDFARERLQYGGIQETGCDDWSKETIDPSSLARRYDCSVYDLECLASQIRASAFGDVYPSVAVSNFFRTDYGVGSWD